VEMPEQTGLLARFDSTITVPYISASNDASPASDATR